MSKGMGLSLEECFADLPDPRIEGRCDHKLLDIIIIAICAVILQATRWHWTIENSYHWVLDVTFGEDHSRIRDGESSENMATLRAAIDNDFLLHLLRPI